MEGLLALAEELDGAYISGIDSFAYWLNRSVKLHTVFLGAALYGYNGRAVRHFRDAARGLTEEIWMEAPYELSEGETDRIPLPDDTTRITTVYGPLPMMITMQRDHRHHGKTLLRSSRGRNVTLYRNSEMCYNVILSDLPVLQDTKSRARAYRFTDETKETMERILAGDLTSVKGIRHNGLL